MSREMTRGAVAVPGHYVAVVALREPANGLEVMAELGKCTGCPSIVVMNCGWALSLASWARQSYRSRQYLTIPLLHPPSARAGFRGPVSLTPAGPSYTCMRIEALVRQQLFPRNFSCGRDTPTVEEWRSDIPPRPAR